MDVKVGPTCVPICSISALPAASWSLIHIIHGYTGASCPIHRPDGAGASASSPADRPPGRRFVKSGRDQLRRLRRRAHRRRRGRALGRRGSARRPAAAAARLRRGSRPPRRSSPQSTMRSRGPMRLICGMSCRATSRTRRGSPPLRSRPRSCRRGGRLRPGRSRARAGSGGARARSTGTSRLSAPAPPDGQHFTRGPYKKRQPKT